jgi:hypothetical protein
MRRAIGIAVGVFFCILALTVSDSDAIRDFGGALRMTWAALAMVAFLAAFN